MKAFSLIATLSLTSLFATGCTVWTTDYSYRHGYGYGSRYADPFDINLFWGDPFYDDYYWDDHHYKKGHHGGKYHHGKSYRKDSGHRKSPSRGRGGHSRKR